MPVHEYDVVIVGGGPAGAAAALTLLLHSPCRVAVIDQGHEGIRPGEHLTPGSRPLLHYLGVDLEAEQELFRPAHHVRSAWGSDRLFERHYLTAPQGAAFMLDRRRFDAFLLSEVTAAGGTVIRPGRVLSIGGGAGAPWRLSVTMSTDEQPFEVSAPQLIDASGRSAIVARRAGIKRRRFDRLVAWIKISVDAVETAASPGPIIESCPYGWWYSTPLPDGRVLAALMTDVDLPRARSAEQRSAVWDAALGSTKHSGLAWGSIHWQEKVEIRAAHSHLLERSCGPGWVAAGDAAMSLDPLSSSGISYALFTGTHAARLTAARLVEGDDLETRYSSEISRIFHEFRRRQSFFYAAERRWPDQAFWRRRVAEKGSAVESATDLLISSSRMSSAIKSPDI